MTKISPGEGSDQSVHHHLHALHLSHRPGNKISLSTSALSCIASSLCPLFTFPHFFDQQGSTRSPEGPEGSQCSHRFEDRNIARTCENIIMTKVRMMISRMVTKETGSEVNERDANNDKVEPAPEHSNMEYI